MKIFLNGEIDLLQNDLPLEMIELLEAKDRIITLKAYGANVSYIGFNFNDSLLRQHKFRKSLTLAVDRQSLIKYFLNDKTRLAEQILPPEHWVNEKLNTLNYSFETRLRYRMPLMWLTQHPMNVQLTIHYLYYILSLTWINYPLNLILYNCSLCKILY